MEIIIAGMEHRQPIRDILSEYLEWLNESNIADFGLRLDMDAMLEKTMDELDIFMPPEGRMLLAVDGDQVMGCVCIQQMGDDLGEIKRMYVRDQFRRQGVARALLERALEEARAIGYRRLRLESARHMTAAHALYRSVGFVDIPPYEGEAPVDHHQYVVFMERLDAG